MMAKGPGAVATPTYSGSKASFFTIAEKELANTLVATDYKDPPMINDTDGNAEYIVRRLTPLSVQDCKVFRMGGVRVLKRKIRQTKI